MAGRYSLDREWLEMNPCGDGLDSADSRAEETSLKAREDLMEAGTRALTLGLVVLP